MKYPPMRYFFLFWPGPRLTSTQFLSGSKIGNLWNLVILSRKSFFGSQCRRDADKQISSGGDQSHGHTSLFTSDCPSSGQMCPCICSLAQCSKTALHK